MKATVWFSGILLLPTATVTSLVVTWVVGRYYHHDWKQDFYHHRPLVSSSYTANCFSSLSSIRDRWYKAPLYTQTRNHANSNHENENDEQENQQQENKNKKSKRKKNKKPQSDGDSKSSSSSKLLSLLTNPYEAGKSFRQSLDETWMTLQQQVPSGNYKRMTTVPSQQKNIKNYPNKEEDRSIYSFDDRFLEASIPMAATTHILSSASALAFLQRQEHSSLSTKSSSSTTTAQSYIPEVLVIGATTAMGRSIVQRLLLDGRFRIRVFVKDLFSQTLNMFGTRVIYCQGNVMNMESLEYALTDVDKIVFVDEEVDEEKKEKQTQEVGKEKDIMTQPRDHPKEAQQHIHTIGMQNLIQAYHNVRHADYGTSQVAKRFLFKFKEGRDDVSFFDVDGGERVRKSGNPGMVQDEQGEVDEQEKNNQEEKSKPQYLQVNCKQNHKQEDETNRKINHTKQTRTEPSEPRKQSQVTPTTSSHTTFISPFSQVKWMKNKFGHGVFTGRIQTIPPLSPASSSSSWMGGKRSHPVGIVSSRLRSRESPEKGIDLSTGFAGFILRICSDGKTYEAFVRTGQFEIDGVEYVCEFDTLSKIKDEENKSMNKFITVRLPFSKFTPQYSDDETKAVENNTTLDHLMPFNGSDVRHIGFRFRNEPTRNKKNLGFSKVESKKWTKFYLGLSYIKVYRSQRDPEFFYLSDARIPPTIRKEMVRHDLRRIPSSSESSDTLSETATIFNEAEMKKVIQDPKDESEEEVYYKYVGEEILKSSGLCYAIARIPKLNELPSGEFSTIRLQQTDESSLPVSRSEVADVCVSALLDPCASNRCFYVTKSKRATSIMDSDKTSKFRELIPET